MANSYSIGNVFGIPIRVHVTLLVFLPLFAFSFSPWAGRRAVLRRLGAVGLFASVALHEIGHSLVAVPRFAHPRNPAAAHRRHGAAETRCRGGRSTKSRPRSPAGRPVSSGSRGPVFRAAAVFFNPLLAVVVHELGRINVMLVC
jgi:hypothetical protein